MGIYLLGASGHGKVILEIAEALGRPVTGFIDANPALTSVYGYEVLRGVPEEGEVFLAIGNNSTRKKLTEAYPDRNFPVLIHPRAFISTRSSLKEGTAVMAGVSINSGVQVGRHGIINTNASIDHDCTLEDFVHISPNAALAGDVQVGEGTHIGIGACVIQGITIGKWCTIGAGTVVIRDVPDGATVVGNPGRIIRSV